MAKTKKISIMLTEGQYAMLTELTERIGYDDDKAAAVRSFILEKHREYWPPYKTATGAMPGSMNIGKAEREDAQSKRADALKAEFAVLAGGQPNMAKRIVKITPLILGKYIQRDFYKGRPEKVVHEIPFDVEGLLVAANKISDKKTLDAYFRLLTRKAPNYTVTRDDYQSLLENVSDHEKYGFPQDRIAQGLVATLKEMLG
jgi:hypothetical protein